MSFDGKHAPSRVVGRSRLLYLLPLLGCATLLGLLLSRSVARSDSNGPAQVAAGPGPVELPSRDTEPVYAHGVYAHGTVADAVLDVDAGVGPAKRPAPGELEPAHPPRPEAPVQTATPALADSLPLSRTTNILVLGSDRRSDEPNWRTDVIILLAMNLETNEAAVISFPRDIYISPIPNHQPNRINVIDYLGERDEPGGGGPRLLASILEERLHIPIHHFVRFDFAGFAAVIDALGGLTVPVDCPLYEYYPEEEIYLALEPGEHQMTGLEALSYVRSRRIGGDLERARRQQRVVWALRRQVVDQNLLPRVPALYAALRDSLETDVGLIQAVQYARFGFSLTEDKVHGLVIGPPDSMTSGWRRGMAVFLADWPHIAGLIQTVFERPPLAETNTVSAAGDRTACP